MLSKFPVPTSALCATTLNLKIAIFLILDLRCAARRIFLAEHNNVAAEKVDPVLLWLIWLFMKRIFIYN